MNQSFPKAFAIAASFILLALTASAQDESAKPKLSEAEKSEIIADTVALGRAYMGGDAKLDAIQSIRLEGVLVQAGGQSGTVESVSKKPGYHQFTSTIAGVREISTLNPTGSWRKLENFQNPGSYTLSFYEVDDLRQLEATILDSLNFLKTPPTRNGRIEYVGTGKVAGKEAIVLTYYHSDSIWFRRYFDPKTGRVMHMVNSKGVVFTYEGDLEVDGVKFPQKILVRYITQYGEQTMEISYASAELNFELDMQRFRVPQAAE